MPLINRSSLLEKRDFTLSVYQQLLDGLQEEGYDFQTFSDHLQRPAARTVMLRHDVDDRKLNALGFAHIQHQRGIVGTYYFRMVPESYDEEVIREISDLGHEVGYHYEDMDFAKGNPDQAIRLFEQHLEELRKVVPVSTICMHGSPLSKFDNRDVWKYYDYRDYGIIGEPYFDLDFREVFYLTDTGRRWDGRQVSVRDKVEIHYEKDFRTTHEILENIQAGDFPEKVMFNFHPQRWTDDLSHWLKEKYTQKIKNFTKYWLIKLR